MKKLTLLLIPFLILYSCHLFRENGIEVEIENNSDTPIADVKFTTTEDLNAVDFRSINPKEKVSDFLTMSDNRLDGSYTLEFTRANGKKEISGHGYYTNGGSLDSRVIFRIEKDTVYACISQY